MKEKNFNIVSNFVRDEFGINFDSSQKKDLERILNNIKRELPHLNEDEFVEKIKNGGLSKAEYETLVYFLTIGETYFFREKKSLDILFDKFIKTKIIEGKKIRIWSAAASSGEEPYSLAIMLNEEFGASVFGQVEIWGSDINGKFIKKAERGIYREWSFRNCPPEIKNKYFTRKENIYKLDEKIRKNVRFVTFNLLGNEYPPPFNVQNYFDFILLRNVLIYFSTDAINKLLEKIYYSLAPEGVLLTGMSEVAYQNSSKFESLTFDGIKLFQKKLNYFHSKEETIVPGDEKLIVKGDKWKFHSEIKSEGKEDNKKEYSFDEIKKDFEEGKFAEIVSKVKISVENVQNRDLENENKRESLLLIAKAFASVGNIDEAIRICEEVTKKFKLDENFFYTLALLQNEKGRIQEALDNLNKSLFLAPDNPLANFLKANILFKLNKNELARKELENTLNILHKIDDNVILEESDGLTVASLKQIIENIKEGG